MGARSVEHRSEITYHFADVDKATQLAIANLDKNFFRVRFDRLTNREREYLLALARLGDGTKRSGDIAEQLGVKAQSVAPFRSSLIKKGMIYSPEYGDTAFTVPLFGNFLLRTMQKNKGEGPKSLFDKQTNLFDSDTVRFA
jgi:hypothetical protein